MNLARLGLNVQKAVGSLSGTREVAGTHKTSVGTYVFAFALLRLLFFAFAYALSEKNPDGIPTTPASTTPQPSLFRSSDAPQSSQATSPGVSQNTTTAP